jgi:large subunit ribosomal protein L18
MINRRKKFLRRKLRIRSKIAKVSPDLPRLSVHRSNKHIWVQIIDLSKNGKVLASASSKEVIKKMTKLQKAIQVGLILAKKAGAKKIKQIIFDRSGYAYKGRVKALADGCREGGLKF